MSISHSVAKERIAAQTDRLRDKGNNRKSGSLCYYALSTGRWIVSLCQYFFLRLDSNITNYVLVNESTVFRQQLIYRIIIRDTTHPNPNVSQNLFLCSQFCTQNTFNAVLFCRLYIVLSMSFAGRPPVQYWLLIIVSYLFVRHHHNFMCLSFGFFP